METPDIPLDCDSDSAGFEELKRAVQAGVDALKEGRSEPWSPTLINANGRRLLDIPVREGK